MIPFVDLKAQYQSIKPEIDAAIGKVLENSQFILGSEVAAFEEEFARYSGGGTGIAVNSGTSALHLALLAAGIGPGDEVITVPFTFVATAAAIGYSGARPVFVDIDPASYTMDPALIEAAITPRTKAIMPVHLYGRLPTWTRSWRSRGGTIWWSSRTRRRRMAPNTRAAGPAVIGDLGCFSFYPGKNLGAYGEGGAVTTSNPEYARTIRMLRDWGQEAKYHHVLQGYNYRMEGIQGAILRVKLRHLEAWTEARRTRAAGYDAALASSGVELPRAMPYNRHVYHVYAVQTTQREDLASALQAQGIQTGIHYPIPIHRLEAWSELNYPVGSFPVAEAVASRILSLPIFPELSDEAILQVASVVRSVHASELVG